MTTTENRPVPDLSIMATIDRAELVAIVESLGLVADDVAAVELTVDNVVIHGRGGASRTIRVVDEWEIVDEEAGE